jgi:competence protein ComEC
MRRVFTGCQYACSPGRARPAKASYWQLIQTCACVMPASSSKTWSPAPWLLAALVGVALQLQQVRLSGNGVYASALAAALVLAALAWRWPRWRALGLVAALMLGWGLTGWRAQVFAAQALQPALEGRDLRVQGRIVGLPQQRAESVQFGFEPEQAWLDGEPVPLPPRLTLGWYTPRRGAAVDLEDETESARQPASIRPGERWRMTVRLKAPHGQRNPHGFDLELALWEQGVQAVGYVRNSLRDAPPQRLAEAGFSVSALRQSVRSAIFAQVPDRALAGVLAALVLGDQAAIERADWDVFRATGVAHLMSISGLHITLFAWLAARLLRRAWQASARWSPALCLALPAHRAGAWGGLLLAWAYAVFAGWGVPAQRTVAMLAVVVLLRQGPWRWPWPQVWLLAMAVVVAADPWALLQPGFWLSFAAVGVLLATDGQAGPAAGEAGRSTLVRGWQAARRLAREQGAITLALAPLSLMLFQQVSLVGLLANALAIPWVTWAVTPLALLGALFPPLWALAAGLLDLLMALLRPMAAWPHAVLEHAAAPLWCGVAGMAGALLLAMRWPVYLRLLGLPLLLPVLLWQPLRPPPGELEVLALDVGQGAAVLLRTATHSLLYDAGPRYSRESDAGHRAVVPLLRALGERPDVLVLSHIDSDHIGGMAAVLASQPQLRVLASFEPPAEPLARHWQACEAGQRWVWDGVVFEVLHPAPGQASRLPKTNDRSCVLSVRTAGAQSATALLAGDLEARQEAELIARHPQLRADWLLVPHHGSKTSSSAAFLDAVQPRLAVVQAGYRNRFGHPAPEVMARYRERGIAVAATPSCGAVRWQSQAPQTLACQRGRDRRYWHHDLGAD